ncbi:DNA mismatch endonuclease (plasmid) [Azospirillum lipoferum 4B]|uniref:DNA mismatch endonuclease n=2 Tax=Azospirillum lipoferum TaxID=193 RepID=G7ZAE3_AZOL4|nr:DNA mismatch endonuclease [Azospirillum lipoferum 4B]
MARIGPRDSKPEMIVRRLAHALGYRYRLHRRDLPGTPDMVFPRLRKAIFVHGCFWHRHDGCKYSTTPKTRTDFWEDKFKKNTERDTRKEQELRALGWDVLTIWECETRNPDFLNKKLSRWLGCEN